MPERKLSPKRNIKKDDEKKLSLKNYGIMSFYFLLVAAAIASIITFIYYSSVIDVSGAIDDFESQVAKSELSAYGAIISLLFAILMLVAWIAYTVHCHFNRKA